MRIKNVSVEYGRKFNLGNYESLELNISLFAQVDEDENPEAVAAFLWDRAKSSLHEQAEPILEKVSYQPNMRIKVNGVEMTEKIKSNEEDKEPFF